MARHTFPDDFLWGVATSAQQIEGGVHEHGRGESIWDRFASVAGNIEDGSNANVACDHYHRWREDVDLLRAIGVGAYRFSIAWPRVLPQGHGVVNPLGLDFYDGLVDALLEAGIRPFVTLYHWDLPQALQERGGWSARDTAEAFAEYAGIVSARLGDRVSSWATHNEPWCIAALGHEEGHHAPGHRDAAEALRVAHHVLLSHAWATEAVRQNVREAEVGIVLNLTPAHPASQKPADLDAARQFDGMFNRWYLDPLFRGRYPEDAMQDRIRRGHLPENGLPFVQDGDLRSIATPLDFLGVNYYSRAVVSADENGRPVARVLQSREMLTDMGWEVFPEGLHSLLVRLQREYRIPKIYLTENGAAYSDGPDASGRVRDERRIEYLREHLLAAHRALSDGVALHGYFAWSLLDNFEWAHGFSKRFGLYWVDFDSQQRIAKDSALWYRDVIAAGAVHEVAPQTS